MQRDVFRCLLAHLREALVEQPGCAVGRTEGGIRLAQGRSTHPAGDGARRARTPAPPPDARRRRDGCRGAWPPDPSRLQLARRRRDRRKRSHPPGLPREFFLPLQCRMQRRSCSSASASFSSRSSISRMSRPVSRYSTETPSFCASLRSALTDGVLAPASIREMYAYETPGDDKSRWENPRATRRRLRRAPTPSVVVLSSDTLFMIIRSFRT